MFLDLQVELITELQDAVVHGLVTTAELTTNFAETEAKASEIPSQGISSLHFATGRLPVQLRAQTSELVYVSAYACVQKSSIRVERCPV